MVVRVVRYSIIGILVLAACFSFWIESRIGDRERQTLFAAKEIDNLSQEKRTFHRSFANLSPAPEESKKTLHYLLSLETGRGLDTVSMLGKIEDLIPEHVALTQYTHDRWSGIVRLSGIAESAQDVATLMLRLEHAPVFDSVKLEHQETAFETAQSATTMFEISCRESVRSSQ